MTTDEMIKFEVSNCITQIAKETELKIVDGVYTISCENELEFNKEEIKKLLLMFKPMQKELAAYKKALELIAEDSVNSRFYISKTEVIAFYLSKAREANNGT